MRTLSGRPISRSPPSQMRAGAHEYRVEARDIKAVDVKLAEGRVLSMEESCNLSVTQVLCLDRSCTESWGWVLDVRPHGPLRGKLKACKQLGRLCMSSSSLGERLHGSCTHLVRRTNLLTCLNFCYVADGGLGVACGPSSKRAIARADHV